MGSVIGETPTTKLKDETAAPKSLTDILKGSEQPKARSTTRARTSSTPPPPMPKVKAPPQSMRNKVFKTSSARVDESFVSSVRDSRGYTSSWDVRSGGGSSAGGVGVGLGGKNVASFGKGSANSRGSWDNRGGSSASSSPGGSGGRSSGSRTSTSSKQRPFEPAPFTDPGTHNSAQAASSARSTSSSSSSSSREPKRVPPQTPFQSPVTDNNAQYRRRSSQGPFTPFTPPGKRSTNGKPPPSRTQRSRANHNPRQFNFKDTPDNTQPFVGSGAYVDQNTPFAYSPPLQVEPPPRDPNYTPPERPFEPAPFSNPQPHAVRTDGYAGAAGAGPRDKWNRVGNNNRRRQTPPPNTNSANRNRYYEQQQQQQQQQSPPSSSSSRSSSPFDNFKEMFNNMGGGGKKKEHKTNRAASKEEEEEEEPKGFVSGNVEVFSSTDDDEWPPRNDDRQQRAMEAEIIDAEMETAAATSSFWQQEEDKGQVYGNDPLSQHRSPISSSERFSNAWKGGPKPSTYPSTTPYAAQAANGYAAGVGQSAGSNDEQGEQIEDAVVIQTAQQLLISNQEVRAIVARAQLNPTIREAVQKCMGNPADFGQYLEDPVAGPLLSELKKCILAL